MADSEACFFISQLWEALIRPHPHPPLRTPAETPPGQAFSRDPVKGSKCRRGCCSSAPKDIKTTKLHNVAPGNGGPNAALVDIKEQIQMKSAALCSNGEVLTVANRR